MAIRERILKKIEAVEVALNRSDVDSPVFVQEISIGKLRARFNAGITNLVYNICRYEFLCRQIFVAG